MKIQLNSLFPQNDIKISPGSGTNFQKGQAFSGRIVSINGNVVEINTGGVNIKAYSKGNIGLPMNIQMNFEVVESSRDMLVIRPLETGAAVPVSKDAIIAGLLDSMGVEPSPSSVSFLKDGEFILGRNIEKLLASLDMEGREDAVQNIKDILIKPGELSEYIKNFEDNGRLLKMLDALFKYGRSDNMNSKSYTGILGDMVKGLTIQINHDFPLFFIPVPMYADNQPMHGELWIEKDGKAGTDRESPLLIHLLVDTPSLGRVEADILSMGKDLSLVLYCRKDIVPLFEKYSPVIKERISGLGLIIRECNVSELKKPRSFIDFAQLYAKPFTPLDVRA